MASHSSILVWEIQWREEPGGLQSMGSQRVRHDLAAKQQHMLTIYIKKIFFDPPNLLHINFTKVLIKRTDSQS